LSQKNKKMYNYYFVLDDKNYLDQTVMDKQMRDNKTRKWAYSAMEKFD